MSFSFLLSSPTCPSWVRVRAAAAIRYLSDDTHRLWVLKFVEDDERVAIPSFRGLVTSVDECLHVLG